MTEPRPRIILGFIEYREGDWFLVAIAVSLVASITAMVLIYD